jgi:hypothetical protein
MKPTFLIFGSKGLIGSHLKQEIIRTFSVEPAEISRETPISILQNPFEHPPKHFDENVPFFAFYCHGPTNPKVALEIHEKFHVQLPGEWYRWLSLNTNLAAFITCGSVHENLNLSRNNSYLTAKSTWHDKVKTNSDHRNLLHLQMHTVYGNPIPRHSFLGDMAHSIGSDQDFLMSEGHQLREYHHVKDIAALVIQISKQKSLWPPSRILPLNHGRPISLKALATGVFETLKPRSELKVGAFKSHPDEIREKQWIPTPHPFTPIYRDPIVGVSEVMAEELKLDIHD